MARILVVDDDERNRQLYVSLLTPFGYEVVEAGDGQQALEKAKTEKPDLIISDILMPTMNGYEFVSLVRKDPALRATPVIFHSASFLDKQTRALGAACGVSLFILKPCEPEIILATIREALGLERQTAPPAPSKPAAGDAIPFLIDAFYEKGKELDAVSVRLASLLDVGLDLARPCAIDVLLQKAAQAARDVIGANYAASAVVTAIGARPQAFSFVGADAALVTKLGDWTFSGPVFNEILLAGKPLRVFNAFGDLPGLELPAAHPAIRSFLGAPLRAADHVYGWIYVADKLATLEFTDEDAQVLRALAAQVTLAYENALWLQAIEERSARLEAEVEERKRAESRFRMLIETAPTGIVIVDQDGRIVEVNAQGLRMFGYQREELLGQYVEILVPESLARSHQNHRANYNRDPHPRPMGTSIELLGRRKDGSTFPVEISLGPLTTKEGMLVSSTIIDISARKKMEEQLRLAQRMESIGKLAGGVAHDFNNLLAVILGSADVLLDKLPADSPFRRKLELIRQAGSSAADLTRQLLAFSRQQMLQPRLLDLQEIVRRTEKLLTRLIGDNISLTVSLEPSLGSICADPGQVEQVLMNLAVNARDAMPQGGQLLIKACNVDLDETYKQEHAPVIPGPYVMISVEDTGCGMSRETQARVFDPFFTTKELGKGTGLGLATVYGIVKQSGGYIWVYSEAGKGTVFKVYLPRAQRASETSTVKEAEASAFQGSETILLAEDSQSLREMARDYLESIGYTVLEAGSGKEALQCASDFQGRIHLLLTDVVMPEMSGPDLAQQLRACRPAIKVIFTSGYTDDAISRQGALDPSIAFIQKPYRPKALARKIREVLHEAPSEDGTNASSLQESRINS